MNPYLKTHQALRRQIDAGYTMVELATVLVIIALLAYTLVPRLSVQVDQQRLKDDRALMHDAGVALRNFINVNGRLPCPAIVGGNGYEAINVVTPAPNLQIRCVVAFGYLPGRALGLPNLDTTGTVPNPWGRALSNPNSQFSLLYAVTDLTGGAPTALRDALVNLAPTTNLALNGQRRDTIQTALSGGGPIAGPGISLCTSATALTPAATNCGAPGSVYLTDLVAVIISPGANGNGAPLPSNFEIQNRLAGGHLGRAFYYLPYVGSPVGTSSPNNFDDTFEVISFGDMLSQLTAGGWTFAP